MMTVTEELLPCPFCGAEGARMMRNFSRAGDMDYYYLVCDGCGACGPSGRTKDQALTAWAMRPAATAPKAAYIEWIPMSEQWPPICENVLTVCAGKEWPDMGANSLSKGDGSRGYDPELYYWQGGEDFEEVTHWAPLPAIPSSLDGRAPLYAAPPAAEQPVWTCPHCKRHTPTCGDCTAKLDPDRLVAKMPMKLLERICADSEHAEMMVLDRAKAIEELRTLLAGGDA